MLKQIIILGVIAYASCVSVDECRFGESFWCQSIASAKKCDAVQHCMTTVWQNQKLPEDNKDTCQFCVNIMKDVKTFLDNKQNQDEIKQFLMSACKVVPDTTIAEACVDAVNQDFSFIIQMVEQAMDPQTVCATLGMCTGLKNKVKQPEPIKTNVHKPADTLTLMQKAAAADYCGDCKTFFADVKAMLQSPTSEKQLETLLEDSLCAQLGGMEATCDQLVEEYVPTLVMILSAEFDPTEVCQAMGFCNSTVDPKVLMAQLVSKAKSQLKLKDSVSTTCVVCEFIMKEVDGLLTQNSTEEAILSALDKVCSMLPGTITGECTSFVDQYGPAVIVLLESELSPAAVCTLLGLCKDMTLKSVPRVKSAEECLLCETVIQYVDSIISSQPTEKEIEDALDKVCNFLPKNYQSQCESMVAQYTPMIIQIMKQEASPQQVCEFIGLCNSTANANQEPEIKPQQANLVGLNACTQGPAYWCQTRANAKKCNTEAHCEKHVWN